MTIKLTDADGTIKYALEASEFTALFAAQETTLSAILTAVSDTNPANVAGISTIGTRAYQAGATALAVTTANIASGVLAATEVLLHASAKCFVRVNSAATVNDIPLEAGEKFHLRIPTGATINAITASGTATLNIVPVA